MRPSSHALLQLFPFMKRGVQDEHAEEVDAISVCGYHAHEDPKQNERQAKHEKVENLLGHAMHLLEPEMVKHHSS